ncbi:MAG: ATP synthase F1 subunit delta [Candidatus Izemoplasmatales bacterium]|nr:ATP synthase F1 subunit delta [Candidatus Izemoplasmatales bacterium]
MTDVERQYARAVFLLALEREEIDEVYQELKSFTESLSGETRQFFLHPRIDDEDKHNVIDKVCKNKLLINFLKVVIDNDRMELIETITYAYLDLIHDMNQVVEVNVSSNVELSELNIKKIKKSLELKLLKKIKINQTIDSSIIGGIKLEYQDNVIDQTINSSLESMKQTLLGGN